MNVRNAVAALGLLACVGVASAEITYLSQSRIVRAWTVVSGSPSCQLASVWTDVGAFADTVECSQAHQQGGFSHAIAVHDSSLLPTQILASGHSTGEILPEGGSLGGYGAMGETQMDVRFVLEGASTYVLHLEYQISEDEQGIDTPVFTLEGPEGFADIELTDRNGTVNTDGTMPAGEYRLSLNVGRSVGFPTFKFSSSFELSFEIAGGCTADFNGDGSVGSQDFFDFLTAFFANDGSADISGDGLVTSQDFFDFLTAFFAGC